VTENEELAALGWKHFNARDYEALLQLIHPDVEWRPAQGPEAWRGA
jgi:ketosteroid isomerase-like protein